MHKIVLVFVAAIIIVSCSQKKYGAFVVKGEIGHAPDGQMLYIERVAFNSATNVVFDSVKLKADGKYELKANDKEENLYLLTLNHKPLIILINDGRNIQANIDLTNYHQPIFTGSPASQKLYTFISHFAANNSALRNIEVQMDSLNKKNPSDSLLRICQYQGMKIIGAINDEMSTIIHTSNNPALICYVLDKARNTFPPAQLDSLVKEASVRFKEHSGVAIIKSLLAQEEAQQQGASSEANYPLLNQQAPDLTMTGIDGKPLSISSFKGKYLLVDFWASWCGPCRGENPNVVVAYNKFKNKNFTILGVSLDKDKDNWQKAIKQDGLAWNHMSDLKEWESAAVTTYQFTGIPFNVLIDPNGKIIASSLRGPELEQKLAEVLK